MLTRDTFDANELHRLLAKLGTHAAARGVQRDLTIVGGAAMALSFDARRSTHDIDVVRASPSMEFLRALARDVAIEEALGERWISDDAARFAARVSDGTLVHESPGIRARTVSDVQLLAMKLDAMRDDVDRSDAISIAARLGFDQMSTELSIAPFLAPERYRRACHELDDIWGEVEGARG